MENNRKLKPCKWIVLVWYSLPRVNVLYTDKYLCQQDSWKKEKTGKNIQIKLLSTLVARINNQQISSLSVTQGGDIVPLHYIDRYVMGK